MLAEACATELPVLVYSLPIAVGGSGIGGRVVDAVLARAASERPNERGTVRPQRGLARWCARLVDEGLLRPTRDLSQLLDELVALGRVESFHDAPRLDRREPLREAPGVARRVRELMGVPER